MAKSRVPPPMTTVSVVAPKACATWACKVPELTLVAVVYVLVASKFKGEVPCWITPVTLVLMTEEINADPLFAPSLIMKPVLLTVVAPERVMLLAAKLLSYRYKLPVPVVPWDKVSVPLPSLKRTVPLLLTVSVPLIVSAVELSS